MRTLQGRAKTALGALAAGTACLLALPAISSGGPASGVTGTVDETVGGAQDTVGGVTDGVTGAVPGGSSGGSGVPSGGPVTGGSAGYSDPGLAAPAASTPPGYQPPLHGTGPHGQGTVGTVDVQPESEIPYSGETDGDESGEDAVAGRSRGEQREDGRYHGKVEVLALGGNSIVAPTETEEGETEEDELLELGCAPGDQLCLQLVATRSSTDGSGSENSFTAAFVGAGGPDGVAATGPSSEGNIEEGSGCQRSEGGSTVASASALGLGTSSVGRSSASSEACNDGTRTQRNDSSVLVLFDQPVPLPAPGCGAGDPDTLALDLIPLAAVVCNADDTNGAGEDEQQTSTPYGVREALTAFVGIEGDTALLKLTASASESHAVAPGGPGPGPGPGPNPPPDDGGDVDPDPPVTRQVAFPSPAGDGPGAGAGDDIAAAAGDGDNAAGGGDELPFTGVSLVVMAIVGALLLAAGAALRRGAPGRRAAGS